MAKHYGDYIGDDDRSYIDIWVSSTSGLTSTVQWRIGWTFRPSSPSDRSLRNGWLYVGSPVSGDVWKRADQFYTFSGNYTTRDQQFGSGSFNVTHNSSGDATVHFNWNIDGALNGGGYSGSNATYNYSLPRLTQAPGKTSTPTVSNITATTATLSWSAPSSGTAAINDYDCHVCTSETHSSAACTIEYSWTGSSSRTKTLTGMDPATTYYAAIRARSPDGTGEWSNWRSFTTSSAPPDKPLGITLLDRTSSSIQVERQDGTTNGSLTLREWQCATDAAFTNVVGTAGNDEFSPTFTGLTRATPHYIRYRVGNAAGTSPWSDTLTTSTLAELPGAPGNYSATSITSETAYTTNIVVTDNGGGSILATHVEVNDVASEIAASPFESPGLSNVFMHSMLPGDDHFFRVAVENEIGVGAWGSWVPFTTLPNTPSPPFNPIATELGDTSGRLTWEAPEFLRGSTLNGYTVRLLDEHFAQLLSANVGAAVVQRDFTGLQPGTTYYAQVWARSSNGLGAFTEPQGFTTTGTAPDASYMWKRIGGVWYPGVLWKKIGGTWRQGILWKNVAGTWRKL